MRKAFRCITEVLWSLQKTYFYEFGAALLELMTCNGIDPTNFLDFVRDIDVSVLVLRCTKVETRTPKMSGCALSVL